jgi:hypothetical protein
LKLLHGDIEWSSDSAPLRSSFMALPAGNRMLPVKAGIRGVIAKKPGDSAAVRLVRLQRASPHSG